MRLALTLLFALTIASCVDDSPPAPDAGVDASEDASICEVGVPRSRYPYAAGWDCVVDGGD